MADSTILEYIDSYRNLDISYDKLHYQEVETLPTGENIIVVSDSILTKYKNDLKSLAIQKTFTTQEENKYFYNPQILSYDLYGSTQYWHLLLELNNMSSAIEFTQNPILVYNGVFPDMINRILALEEDSININSQNVTNAISQ